MLDLRINVFVLLVGILASCTTYSIIHNSYLDTSNPLLTHLPHPLGDTHYFANKSNPLNVYFIKYTWAWTSGAFFLSCFTSDPRRTLGRVGKWVVETVVFVIFTTWFFGPALLERLILASGGECILVPPTGSPISVPPEFCLAKTSLSPAEHPDIFATITSTFDSVDWHAVPRLRKGHDISGHTFLLTMASLFLADQLRYSLNTPRRSVLHTAVMTANFALIGVWLFAMYTTCLYFHSPLEKVTGFRTLLSIGFVFISITSSPSRVQFLASPGLLLPFCPKSKKRLKPRKQRGFRVF